MKKKFFFKRLLSLLTYMTIPIILLGSITIIISFFYIRDNSIKDKLNLINQTKQNVELMVNEIETLSFTFDNNPAISQKLSSLLNKQTFEYEDYDRLKTISDFFATNIYARPYLNSIYVYYNNPFKQFITTDEMISNLNIYHDNSWYKSFINKDKTIDSWTETRKLLVDNNEDISTSVISIYKRLYDNDGVLVLNISQSYVNGILSDPKLTNGQSIFILDQENQIIFQNTDSNFLKNIDLVKINSNSSEMSNVKSSGTDKIVLQLTSPKYGWRYISVIPYNTFYKIPLQFLNITIILFIGTLILSVIFAYLTSKKNYDNLMNIVRILDFAKSGNLVQPLPTKEHDEYDYIIQNIITSFIEKNYLKTQLSERKYKLQVMELRALQSQINPHFLFNTLETINWKVIGLTGKPNEVNDMIGNLSDIMKYSLYEPDQIVPIEDEIKNTISYINILKIRYKNKFTVKWQYKDDVKNINVVKLIIQPLIENCLYHGIKEKSGQGMIKIKIKLKDDRLQITVIDNGIGIEREVLKILKRKLSEDVEYEEHIGLFNTDKRIKLAYGQDYGVHLKSKFHYGTSIHINIPANIK